MERCFDDDIGRQFHDSLKRFNGVVYQQRWGTVMFALPQLLDIQVPLRYGWSYEAYLKGSDEPPQEVASDREEIGGDFSGRTRAQIANSAITDPSWWGYLAMLDHVGQILRKRMAWAESCPCHYPLHDSLDVCDAALAKQLLATWEQCPRRGCRAPCLAAGDFLDLVRRTGDTLASELLSSLPHDLAPEQRSTIMSEYKAARSFLVFYFTIQLSHWEELPWVCYKIGHMNDVFALDALQVCLRSNHPHPVLQEL